MAQEATGLAPDLAGYLDSLVEEPAQVFPELREHIDENLPEPIQISPHQGRFLAWLVRTVSARSVLEVGTFAGYSTMWFAWALGSEGRIVTLEKNADRSAVAARWHGMADLGCSIDYRVGDAGALLDELPDDSFDVAFVDADKGPYPRYLEACIRCVRPGGLIIADNAFHHGRVLGTDPRPSTQGILEYNRRATSDPRLSSVLVPVGDGLMLSTVLASN